jgi:hypothetical protein
MHRTTIEPLDLQEFFAESTSPAATSEMVAQFAEEQLAEVQSTNAEALGHASTYERYVDGIKGAALNRVKPNGTIVFEFDVVSDVFAWIAIVLRGVSPVLSGRYAASHEFYADGLPADPEQPPAAKVFQFISTLPYAGQIEGEDGTPKSKQAPSGVYQVVAAMAAQRYPGSDIQFAFLNSKPTITIKVG